MKRYFIFIAFLIFCDLGPTAVAAQERIALYRYVAPKSKNDVYAAFEAHRNYYKQQNYKEINVVGYVYPEKQPGTTALYHLLKKDGSGGKEHFYTASFDEALAKQNSENGAWMIDQLTKGIVGYVPTKSGGDAKSVTRFLQSDGKTNIYAFSKTEHNGFVGNRLANQGIAFYVFSSPASAAQNATKAPDVQIGKIVKVTDKTVTFIARSIGGSVPAGGVAVEITAYNADGSEAWRQLRLLSDALPQGSLVETTIELVGGRSLAGMKFKLKLDGDNKLDEPLENNNESKLTDGTTLVIGKIITPSIPVIILPQPATGVDLMMRKALYFNGAETKKVLTNSPYATPRDSLRLKKSQATSCSGDTCQFNFGFYAQRSDAKGELSTYATLTVETAIVGNTVFFANGEGSKDVVHNLQLKVGENKVVVALDSYNKIAEPDETNNRFVVIIIVENQ